MTKFEIIQDKKLRETAQCIEKSGKGVILLDREERAQVMTVWVIWKHNPGVKVRLGRYHYTVGSTIKSAAHCGSNY